MNLTPSIYCLEILMIVSHVYNLQRMERIFGAHAQILPLMRCNVAARSCHLTQDLIWASVEGRGFGSQGRNWLLLDQIYASVIPWVACIFVERRMLLFEAWPQWLTSLHRLGPSLPSGGKDELSSLEKSSQ